jgi:signal transduction histidine kinase
MKATFFSSVAHELRTPLNSIIPMLKLILDTIIPCFNNILEVEKLTRLL